VFERLRIGRHVGHDGPFSGTNSMVDFRSNAERVRPPEKTALRRCDRSGIGR
jgi:hypothetical protein